MARGDHWATVRYRSVSKAPCRCPGGRQRVGSGLQWRLQVVDAGTRPPAVPWSGAGIGEALNQPLSPQVTTRTSVSSVAAASGTRAHSKATSASTRARSPTSAMAAARSSASSTSWRRTTGCTQVRGPARPERLRDLRRVAGGGLPLCVDQRATAPCKKAAAILATALSRSPDRPSRNPSQWLPDHTG